MAEYQIYLLDDRDRVVGGSVAHCFSDEDARVATATKLAAGAKAELWAGTRCLGIVCSPPKPAAETAGRLGPVNDTRRAPAPASAVHPRAHEPRIAFSAAIAELPRHP